MEKVNVHGIHMKIILIQYEFGTFTLMYDVTYKFTIIFISVGLVKSIGHFLILCTSKIFISLTNLIVDVFSVSNIILFSEQNPLKY